MTTKDDSLYLIKIGEITLKKGNRFLFERQLKKNIQKSLGNSGSVVVRDGRFYLNSVLSENDTLSRVSSLPGIVNIYKTYPVEKDLEAIKALAVKLIDERFKGAPQGTFRVECRRTDKSLPFRSQECAAATGGAILEQFPHLVVNLGNPDWKISIELREKGYLYLDGASGAGGLPCGSSGKGLLLLSGGIDSPVAGYMMALRGIDIHCIHFHTPPYTSDDSLKKVEKLASCLCRQTLQREFSVVNFTPLQKRIKEQVPEGEVTLHSRAAMMKIAEKLAEKEGMKALITGESLGQVASQTVEGIAYTGASSQLPLFRPLIGLSKEDIIKIAKKIDTYPISIEPHSDCCALFSPDKPLTRPPLLPMLKNFSLIEGVDQLIEEAVLSIEKIQIEPKYEKS